MFFIISFLIQKSQGIGFSNRMNERTIVHKRFYIALMLNDLVREVDFQEIMNRYDINRGALQTLQQTSSTFAGMVRIFTEKLGWKNLELLIKHFQDRLYVIF